MPKQDQTFGMQPVAEALTVNGNGGRGRIFERERVRGPQRPDDPGCPAGCTATGINDADNIVGDWIRAPT